MNYVKKQCPECGNEFVVIRRVAHRELFCTLGCLSKAEAKFLKLNLSPY
jgi:predicted RNA-binding Zn-ribbon protein involved in translation (DUF1610 family)